jgi:flavin reductase (DIM6/NTAB) family NADH-FMN oxidoreductase RutF
MYVVSEPAILYFGTPVVLISTLNEDGSYNLAPMSSAWWLTWRAVLGFGAHSKTPQNITRTGECVLNLPTADMVGSVNRLALTTGSNPVPPSKAMRGYRYEREKFACARLTPIKSDIVSAPRVLECPVQMEASLESVHSLAEHDVEWQHRLVSIEVRIRRVHLDDSILVEGSRNRIDPDKWQPLIMSFQHFYGLTPKKVSESALARIPESLYRGA